LYTYVIHFGNHARTFPTLTCMIFLFSNAGFLFPLTEDFHQLLVMHLGMGTGDLNGTKNKGINRLNYLVFKVSILRISAFSIFEGYESMLSPIKIIAGEEIPDSDTFSTMEPTFPLTDFCSGKVPF